MRIFLTGASGFIGKHLVTCLTHHQLLLISRVEISDCLPNVSYVQGDLAAIEQWGEKVRDFAPEVCIHLAWSGLPDYSLTWCLQNFETSVRLFDFLGSLGCKKIFAAGTCWEYGDLHGQVSEKDTPNKMNLFASFKTGLRLVGESVAAYRGIEFIWGRIFFVYGHGQRETSLIPYCYRILKSGNSPKIDKPASMNDFVHVSDVANAIVALIETPNISGVFNIGSGTPSKVGEVVKIIARTMELEKLLPKHVDPSEGRGIWADISLIQRKTRWRPLIPLEIGIEQTIAQIEQRE